MGTAIKHRVPDVTCNFFTSGHSDQQNIPFNGMLLLNLSFVFVIIVVIIVMLLIFFSYCIVRLILLRIGVPRRQSHRR